MKLATATIEKLGTLETKTSAKGKEYKAISCTLKSGDKSKAFNAVFDHATSLSGFAAGDEIEFDVKQGKEGYPDNIEFPRKPGEPKPQAKGYGGGGGGRAFVDSRDCMLVSYMKDMWVAALDDNAKAAMTPATIQNIVTEFYKAAKEAIRET